MEKNYCKFYSFFLINRIGKIFSIFKKFQRLNKKEPLCLLKIMSNLKNEEKKLASNSQKGFAQHLLTQEIDSKAKKPKKNSKKKDFNSSG